MIGLLLELFKTFFIIGLFNFGGGSAMISLIQNQVVSVHGWITEAAFTDITAISQTTPGPIGINCATYIGYQIMHDAGYSNLLAVLGSGVAAFAIVLPSFLIFYILMKIVMKYQNTPIFEGTMTLLKPAVAGLILAAAFILTFTVSWSGFIPHINIITDNFPDITSWILFAAAFVATYFFKANPIWVIVIAGISGLILY